ncbi:MAG: VPLPA-CTERM sorting domain-containing protein [Aestuariivirga sp.]|nr:VPLPA-CTERM sorting domain-containing protein [Aestuariivirga sp.]
MVSRTLSARTAFAAVGLLCAGFVSASPAATVTYDFTGATTGYTLTKDFTSGLGNPLLTVSANTVSTDGSVVTPVTSYGVGQWSGLGLGIKNSSTDNSHTIDGYGLNDLLVLAFSSSVTFLSATFTYAGVLNNSFDDFAFFASPTNDGSVAGDMIFSSEDIIGTNGTGYYNFTTGAYGGTYFGQFFGIGAIFDAVYQECVRYRYGNCKEWNSYTVFDSFKLASVTVDYTPPQTTPEVPLPAGLVLMLSALAGLSFFNRSKSKAAA